MNIAVLYHSESGNTRSVADLVADGARLVEGTQVRTMDITSIDDDYINRADVLIVGFPVYAGSCSWQIKKWLDTTNLTLAGKLGGVFATENHIGGGADLAELIVIGGMLVRGMLVYSAGASRGQPFTHYGAVTIKDGDAHQQDRARILGERIARKAQELWGAGSERSSS